MWVNILIAILVILGISYTIWKVPAVPKWVKIVFIIIVIVFGVRECKKTTSEKETTTIENNVEN
jgi:arginine exporter protein ArgO